MGVRLGDKEVRLNRADVRFPVELRTPDGFLVDGPETWPRVDGRLEYVGGRLWFMPPTGDVQQDVAADVAFVLRRWTQKQPQFVVATNEAGMLLGGDVRAADAAVWRRDQLGEYSGGYRRAAPVLAVEIAGRDDGEQKLRDKANWYLDHGVHAVWLVLPDDRRVVVLSVRRETQHRGPDALPRDPALPGLRPRAAEFFGQLDSLEVP